MSCYGDIFMLIKFTETIKIRFMNYYVNFSCILNMKLKHFSFLNSVLMTQTFMFKASFYWDMPVQAGSNQSPFR